MTKFGQTSGFTASDFVFELYKYLAGGVVQTVLINQPLKMNKAVLKRYQEEKAQLVIDDLDISNPKPQPRIIRADLVSDVIYEKPKSDVLFCSLIRHDPDKLAKALMNLI